MITSCVNDLASLIDKKCPAGIIAIEGMSNSGKTTLARQLAELLSGTMLNTDDYRRNPDGSLPYSDRIARSELESDVLSSKHPTLLHGICLRLTLEGTKIQPSRYVYVKALNSHGVWKGESVLEKYGRGDLDPPHHHLWDMQYHIAVTPQELSDDTYTWQGQ